MKLAARLLSLLAGVSLLGMVVGCGGIRPEDLPAEQAWKHLQDEYEGAQAMAVLGYMGGSREMGDAFAMMAQDQQRARESAERQMVSAMPAQAFEEMVDDVASYLVTRLPGIVDESGAITKKVLVVDVVKLRGDTQATPLLDRALSSLRSRLQSNQAINDNFVLISADQVRAAGLLDQLGAAQSVDLAPVLGGAAAAGPARYAASDIYLITGEFFQTYMPMDYSLEFRTIINVTQPATLQFNEQREFVSLYKFSPYPKGRGQWLSPAENERRWEEFRNRNQRR